MLKYGVPKDENEVIEIITNKLNKKLPIAIYFDSYYCPWNPSYKIRSTTHYCLAVDLDVSANTISFIDPMYLEGVECINLKEYIGFFKAYICFNILNEKEIEKVNFNHLFFEAAKHNFYNGICCSTFETIRKLIKEIEIVDFERDIAFYKDIRVHSTITFIHRILCDRSNFIELLSYMAQRDSEFIYYNNVFKEIKNEWAKVKMMIIKYGLLKRGNKLLVDIQECLMNLANTEETIANEILIKYSN